MANIEPITDPSVIARFKAKYRENENGCWVWTGSKDKDGYGQFRLNGVIQRSHRVSWLINVGPLDPDRDLDHLCHIRKCVNPHHLEEVDHLENMRRIHGKKEEGEDGKWYGRQPTTPEQVLEWVEDVIAKSDLKRPPCGRGEEGYGVKNVEAPWRDCTMEDGYMPQDKFSLIALYLDAVRMGVNWRDAATAVLDINPLSLWHWDSNPMWREDLVEARNIGRKSRLGSLEYKLMDKLEERIDTADYKDLVRLQESYDKREEIERRARKDADGGTPALGPGARVQLVFNGSPDQQEELLTRVVRVLTPAQAAEEHEDDNEEDE